MTEAAAEARRGKAERAKLLLLEVTGNSTVETRVLLWSWTALRCLGIRPKSKDADEIRGVVIQVPMGKGIDVLAAYADVPHATLIIREK